MFKSHQSKTFSICLAATILVLVLFFKGWLDTLEMKAVDLRFHLRGNRAVNDQIVVITVDEASIEQLGRWPWPRAHHAKLVETLVQAGAKVVAFDSLFTEMDKDNPASDLKLAQTAQDVNKVVSSFLFRGGMAQKLFGKDPLFPYKELAEASYTGFVNLDPDHDGVTRRAYLYAIQGETVYPSLAVATLALSRGQTVQEVFKDIPVVLDQDPIKAKNDLFVNFAFDPKSPTGYAYPTYSYVDVFTGKIKMTGVFKDKIVFVGATAAALFDLKAIPFVSLHPGVMIHANVVDNLIARNYLKETPLDITVIYVFLLGLFLGIAVPRLSTWLKLGLFLAVVGTVVSSSVWLFSNKNLVIPMVPPLLVCVGSYGGILFYQLVIEEREKRKIKGSFKQYLSPKIIDVITKDPSKLKLGGEEREVTVFFLDIAGFTTMSEALKPSQLVEVMNECLTEFSRIIFKHDGLINKYIGDCIMAFWNAPADQPKHASQACWAALECIAALPSINKRFQEKGLPSIDCRIGINTGTVVVGNMGSLERFDYTVMGDAVNLASRLEGANKQYNTRIMISDAAFEKAKDDIEARDLDLIRVKGKKEPRKVYEVLCRKGEITEELTEGRNRYHEALRSYRHQKFDEAIEVFSSVFSYLPNDHVSRVYLERARVFVNNPPPANWDGVFELKTK